jgi:hypothetical protein
MRHPLFSVVLALSLGTATTPVKAQHHQGFRHFDHHQHRGNWGWVAPAVIGGAVVYGLTHSAPVVVQQQPVYIQQPVAPVTVVIDGVVYVKQVMVVNGVAQEVLVRQ